LKFAIENDYNIHIRKMEDKQMDFIVEVSARHAHVSQKDLEILFGEGYQLTEVKELSQPGQYLAKEKITIKKGDAVMERISILGPVRSASQVELSMTDCVKLKAKSVIRESGDLSGSEAVTLVGPNGSVDLPEGLIVAKRHIHMTPEDAEKFGVKDKQIVAVSVESEGRKLIFEDTIVRVNPTYALAMHIDTDEGNAAMVPRDGGKGKIVTIEA
jgi:putative phosphotransacetylase